MKNLGLQMFLKPDFGDKLLKKKDIKEIENAALNGDALSQYKTGYFYQCGIQCRKNSVIAAQWYEKAAVAGIPEAQCNLATMYMIGEGVEANCVKAIKWYTKAAENDNLLAMEKLGLFYFLEDSIGNDYAKGEAWLQRAEAKGSVFAKVNLATRYVSEQNNKEKGLKGIAMLEEAVALNDGMAMNNLASCYMNGEVLERDRAKAFMLFKESAKAGYALGQFNLARCYINGEGVYKDVYKSIPILIEAARNREPHAIKILLEMYDTGDSTAIAMINRKEIIHIYNDMIRESNKGWALIDEQKRIWNSAQEKEVTEKDERKQESKSIIERETELVTAGIRAKRAGDFAKAIEYYKQAIKLIPENGNTYYALGKLLYLTKEYDKSITSYVYAYLNNANCDLVDLYRHAGHALLDKEEQNVIKHNRIITVYRNTLLGHRHVPEDFMNDDYQQSCIEQGKLLIEERAEQMSKS